MKRNIAYVLGIMLLAASCISEQGLDVNSTRKDEVKFVADMKSAVTKTLYGADHAKTIKVKWVNGDQIKVFGTDCAVSTGEYQITEAANKPNVDGVAGETIADALTRLGDVGVQWGSEKSSDFVAVYPAENASFDYKEETGDVVISTAISSVQNYVFDDEVNTEKTTAVKVYGDDGNLIETRNVPIWEGTHFANDATNPSMPNAIMYARTDNVSAGSNVSLSFEPFSTVLKFRFEGFTDLWDKGTDVYIQSITIEAPSAIAGNFDITVPRGVSAENPVTAKATGSNSNIITINTIKAGGSYLKITANQAVEFNVFTLPLSNMTISETSLWTVSIQVQGVAAPYKYKMIPTAEGGYKLVPGLVHKVKIPALKVTTPPVWTPGNWITQIPKPVYISELSVPGAWYCFDSDYQSTTNLANLYSQGIRAFNIDCRLSKKDLNDVTILGFQCDRAWDDNSYLNSLKNNTDYGYLACAGSEPAPEIGFSDYQMLPGEGTYVSTAVGELVKLAKQHADEYIIIVFTFADKPFSNSGAEFGSVNPIWIMSELTKVLDEYSDNIYTGISKDTTIEDVLKSGKNVIVKINYCTDDYYENDSYLKFDHDNNTSTNTVSVVPEGIMGSFASMSSNSSYNTRSDVITNIAGLHNETVYADYFTTMRFNDIYNGTVKSDMIYCYHQAQYTTGSLTRGQKGTGNPSLGMRMDAIDDIIKQSKSVYDDALHNHWFQMGIGGSLNGDDPEGVSKALNPYLYGKIVEKMNTDPSPVGVVLMNHATSTSTYTVTTTDVNNQSVTYSASSQDLVKAIIEMNGKFYLNRKGNDVITGGGEQNGTGSGTETKASAYVGPDAF